MDPAQYKASIEFLFDNLPEAALMAYGHSGLGKSDVPVQVAKERGCPMIYLDCTGMEPTDLLGLPDNKDSEYTRYKTPEFFKLVQTEPRGILILDEVTRLDMQVRHTVMQILVRREIGNVKMNPGWMIVMTANPDDGNYQVAALDPAYGRRCIVTPVSFNMEVWRDWAIQNDVHPRVLGSAGRLAGGLMKEMKKGIEQTLTPFGLTLAGKLLKAGLPEKLEVNTGFELLVGTVGENAAAAIQESINDQQLNKLLAQAMAGEKLGQMGHDMAIALVAAFLQKIGKETRKNAKQIKNLYDQLNTDIRMILIKACYQDLLKYPDEFEALVKEWAQWCSKQQKALLDRKTKK